MAFVLSVMYELFVGRVQYEGHLFVADVIDAQEMCLSLCRQFQCKIALAVGCRVCDE